MINNDKVRLMTRIQLFENREKESVKVNRYFQMDYLVMHMIRSLFAYIVLFCMVLLFILCYNWEEVLTQAKPEMLIQSGMWILIGFLALMIPSMIVSYISFWFCYRRGCKKIRNHISDLKELQEFYSDEGN